MVKPGSSSATAAKTPVAGPSKPERSTDKWANYSTAASLGFSDPDAERLKAEEERRRKEGTVGAWEVVAIEEPAAGEEAEQVPKAEADVPADEPLVQAQSLRKREAEAQPDDDDTRQFKLRRKKLGAGLGEIYDPGLIPIKLKAKKEEPVDTPPKEEASGSDAPLKISQAIPIAKGGWSKSSWSGPKEAKDEKVLPSVSNEPVQDMSSTEGSEQLSAEPSEPPSVDQDVPEVKAEPSEVKREETDSVTALQPASLFRKRKVPAGGAGSRGRRP